MPPRGRGTSRSKSKTAEPRPLTAETRICVLHGPDAMQKRLQLQSLREALEKTHGEVQQFNYDGFRADLAEVLDELRSFGLMQTYKLVVVDAAEEFAKNHRPALERYADAPTDHATLVLRSDKWQTNTNLDKKIEAVGAVVRCDEPTPDAARRWVNQRAEKAHHCRLEPAAADLLVERLGTDLMMLDTELAKLALMTGEDATVTADLVRQAVGRTNEEQAYAMQEAVLEGMARRSAAPMLAKLHELVDLGGQPDVLVGYFVGDTVRKLNVALLAKRAGASQGEWLKQAKVWGPRQRPFLHVLDRLSPRQASALLSQALTADARAKSGRGTTMRNLEALCVRLADEVR